MRVSGVCRYAFEIVSTSPASLMPGRVGVCARMMLQNRFSLRIILPKDYTVLYPPPETFRCLPIILAQWIRQDFAYEWDFIVIIYPHWALKSRCLNTFTGGKYNDLKKGDGQLEHLEQRFAHYSLHPAFYSQACTWQQESTLKPLKLPKE